MQSFSLRHMILDHQMSIMQREMKLTLNDGMLFQIVALLNWLERAINTPYFSALDFPILQFEILSLMKWIFSQFETNCISFPFQMKLTLNNGMLFQTVVGRFQIFALQNWLERAINRVLTFQT